MSEHTDGAARDDGPDRERLVYLLPDKALVAGATYALIVDFGTGALHRLNRPGFQVLELSRQGTSVEQAVQQLNLDLGSTESLLGQMQAQNLVSIEHAPRGSVPAPAAPSPDLAFLWLEVVSQCNLRCLHCYAELPETHARMPDTATLLRWIDQAADLNCKRIQFTGGECTVREDLMQLLAHARSRTFEVIEIFTNATFTDSSLIPFLADNGIRVAVSLYSYKASSHDLITGVPGSYSRTIENLKLLLAHDVPVRGSIIVLRENEDEADATEVFLRELGVQVGSPDPVRPCGRGRTTAHWPRRYGQRIVRTRPDFLPDREQFVSNHHWNSCWFGKAAVSAEGDVFPCVFARDLLAGNLHEQSLERIVSGPLRTFWQLTRDQIAVCRDCEYRYLCRDCRPWALGYAGDLRAKTPTCTYDPYSGQWGPAEGALRCDRAIQPVA